MQEALDHSGQCRIAAVFVSVFYFKRGDKLIAVANSSVEPGPLTLVTNRAGIDMRQTGLKVGQKAFISSTLIKIANLNIDLRDTVFWTPPQHQFVSSARLALGLERMHSVDLKPPPSSIGHIDQQDVALMTNLDTWIAWAFNQTTQPAPPTWARGLLGRGQGLTPSGDDFLGGVMIAFHALNRPLTAQRLWNDLRTPARTATNEISRALLSAAAQGYGSASLHQSIQALFDGGRDLEQALAQIDQIGHSSGWDALAGVKAVLSGFLRSQVERAA